MGKLYFGKNAIELKKQNKSKRLISWKTYFFISLTINVLILGALACQHYQF